MLGLYVGCIFMYLYLFCFNDYKLKYIKKKQLLHHSRTQLWDLLPSARNQNHKTNIIMQKQRALSASPHQPRELITM